MARGIEPYRNLWSASVSEQRIWLAAADFLEAVTLHRLSRTVKCHTSSGRRDPFSEGHNPEAVPWRSRPFCGTSFGGSFTLIVSFVRRCRSLLPGFRLADDWPCGTHEVRAVKRLRSALRINHRPCPPFQRSLGGQGTVSPEGNSRDWLSSPVRRPGFSTRLQQIRSEYPCVTTCRPCAERLFRSRRCSPSAPDPRKN